MCKHSMMLSLAKIQQIIDNTIILALSGIFCIFAAKQPNVYSRIYTN